MIQMDLEMLEMEMCIMKQQNTDYKCAVQQRKKPGTCHAWKLCGPGPTSKVKHVYKAPAAFGGVPVGNHSTGTAQAVLADGANEGSGRLVGESTSKRVVFIIWVEGAPKPPTTL